MGHDMPLASRRQQLTTASPMGFVSWLVEDHAIEWAADSADHLILFGDPLPFRWSVPSELLDVTRDGPHPACDGSSDLGFDLFAALAKQVGHEPAG